MNHAKIAIAAALGAVVMSAFCAETVSQRYTPIDGGFEIEGGEAKFNRPLYGWHGDDEKKVTRFYVMTSDRPVASVQNYPRPRHLGSLTFGDGTESVRFRYVRGRAEYDLKGKGTVRMARSPDVPDLLVETTDGIEAKWDGEWIERAKSQKDGKTYYAFARKGCKAPPPTDIPAAFEKAVAHLESLSRELVVKTPDKVLDALVACNGVAMDAEMEGDGIASGATSWRNPFPGWRVGYALTALGRDEAFKAFVRYHLKSQKKDGRVPCNVGRDGVYNFNEVFSDAVVRHWLRTGDDAFMRDCAYEGVKKHLGWMEKNMRVPDMPLFENWLNAWNTDGKWSNGGAGTIASAYVRFAYRNLARVADRLGKPDDAKAFRARAAEIDAAVDKFLWSEKDGIWGEYRERFGLRRLVTSPDSSTIYTAIDSGLADADPSRAVRALAWYERNTPSAFTPDGQSVIYSSNKLPKFYSSCGLYPEENLHLALVYWQTGETEMAWRHFRSAYFQVVRGPTAGPGALYHGHKNGSLENIGNCDFTDTIAMHFRDVVEGLFGIVIDAPSGKATIRPGFPRDWNEAEIKTPYIGYRWTRAGGVVVTHNPNNFKIDLKTARPKLVGDAMPKPHTNWGEAKGEGSDCSVPAGTAADYVDLSGAFNTDWRLLHKGKYTPRIGNLPWATIPRTLMSNGRAWWEWHEVVCNRRGPKSYCIPKSLDWPKDGILSTKFGPSFRLGPKDGRNSVFTSLYDQLPDETTIPLSGKAKKIAFLTAVVTNPNIAWMEAAQISVEYADGTSATLSLVPPDNCDDWLSYHHGHKGFGMTDQDCKPYAVKGNPVMFGPIAHANVLALSLDPSKELKCLRLVCRGTETFAGLIGATLYK